jgi:hypothetical protein
MAGVQKKREPFRTQTHDLGAARIDIDNVAETLAHAEGDK